MATCCITRREVTPVTSALLDPAYIKPARR